MPDMWIDVDTAVTVPVNLMPLIDDTDFKTRETAVAYNAAGMDLVWNFVTSAGVITQTAVTPTTSGNYDWTHVGDGIYKIEIPASGGASINNDTEGYGWFSGLVTGVLPFRGPVIGFRAAALNNALCDGGDVLDVSVTEWLGTAAATPTVAGVPEVDVTHLLGTAWLTPGTAGTPDVNVKLLSGDATAADNAEAFFDGTGYAGTNNVIPTVTTTTTATNVTTVNGLAAGVITAASIAADAITAAKIADGAIDAATFAAGAITAAAIATNAIDADALAADAVTEIQNGLATPTNITAGTITTVTNLTNAPTSGDLTATMKTSVTTACSASTPASVVGAVGSVTGNVGGNVTGSVGSVVGAVGSVTGNVGGNVTGSVGSLATQAKADVNAEVLDVLNVDTFAEPAQGTPGATITLAAKIGYLYKFLRNRKTQTATTKSIYNDDATTVDHKCTVADDGTTYSETEMTTGP